jgi:spermidine synthase
MKMFGYKRLGVAAVIGLLTTMALAQLPGKIIYEVPSQYQKITVWDTPNGYRQMIFDAKLDGLEPVQSEMNKANPLELTLAYSRHMIASLALVEKPKRILVVGLGGACIQRYLHEVLKETRIDTAELDPAVLTVAQKYFEFKEDARQWCYIGDGRKFIEKSKDKYDVIMLDAFSATSIPYPLSTKEFLVTCKEHLAEGGVLSANLWEAEASYGDMVKTYDAVFPEWHVVRCAGSTNAILTALPTKRALTVEKWMKLAEEFEKTYKTDLNLPKLLDRGFQPVTRTPSTAKVLLDKDEPKN